MKINKRKKYYSEIIIICFLVNHAAAQQQIILDTSVTISDLPSRDSLNKYGLYIITKIAQLQKTIDTDSNKAFVRIKDHVPGVKLDIKYATSQNFVYEKLYDKPYDLTRLNVAKALAKAQAEFKQHGVGLKIYDAYRPYNITCYMFQRIPDTIYMGKPWKGSRHNRGAAVDVTLIDLNTGKELAMPTPFDCLTYPAHADNVDLPDSIINNRELLKSVMQKNAFTVSKNEWWHFDFTAAITYEIVDIPLKELEKFAKKYKRNKIP